MKQFKLLLITLFIACTAMAQLPEAINYQAVARNTAGQALVNQSIKVRMSLLRGPNSLYSETRTVTTNALGLFNVQIGSTGATNVSGNFSSIYWLNNTPAITLKVELDVNNSGLFTEMGNQTLATVPYAFAAKNAIDAVNLGGRYVDNSITPNDGDVMKWSAADNAWKPAAVTPTATNLYGLIGNISASTSWVFVGPSSGTTTITITKPTTIVASASVSLGHSTTGQIANDVSVSPAYQLISGSGGNLTIFQPANYSASQISGGLRTSLPAAGSVTLTTPGTYKIGFAVRNNSGVTLNSNDFLLGYIFIY